MSVSLRLQSRSRNDRKMFFLGVGASFDMFCLFVWDSFSIFGVRFVCQGAVSGFSKAF